MMILIGQSNHISYINSKIAKDISIICRYKVFSKSALINLYYAFIFLYLIYCVEVWGNALSTHTQTIIKLQILISWPLLKKYILKEVFYHLLR